MQIIQEIYVYDESGVYLKSYHNGTKKEIEQQENQKVYLSSEYLGENAIIENNELRAMTREEKILSQMEELKEGEYIKGKEIITVEKPDNFHIWDSKKKKWIYEKQLEIGFINSEILNKEIELNDLYDTLDKATSRRLKALIVYTQGKIDKIKEELETHENRLKELEV